MKSFYHQSIILTVATLKVVFVFSQSSGGDTCKVQDLTFCAMGDCQYGGGPYQASQNTYHIQALNAIPGHIWPEGMPSAGNTVDVPRGLLMAGDITHRNTTAQIDRFKSEYGLTGTDGLLHYPMYEGYGNHDYHNLPLGPPSGVAILTVIERNLSRPGILNIDDYAGHYSWDWNGIHFVNTNLFPGNEPCVNQPLMDPYKSLDFLIEDLKTYVGKSGRPVIIMGHYGVYYSATNEGTWEERQRRLFLDVVKQYNVIAYIHGHSHNTSYYKWNGVDAFNVGSPYYDVATNPDGLGHFTLFRIKEDVLEAVDVAWDPTSPTSLIFPEPTDVYPERGFRVSKKINLPCHQKPYQSISYLIPGIIESEKYDEGGEQISFHENVYDGITQGETAYRSDGVDISAANGGFHVSHIVTGEWLEYTVEVTKTGVYDIGANFSKGGAIGESRFHLEIDNDTIGVQAVVTNTGGWNVFKQTSLGQALLTQGKHVIRFVADQGNFNIDNFTFVFNSFLPVSIVSFTGSVTDNSIELKWSTSSEKNNAYFILERSTDGINYQKIGQVKASNISNPNNNYQFYDNSPSSGINYYKLIQVDIDGSATNIGLVEVSVNMKDQVSIYPNPGSGMINLEILLNNASSYELDIYNSFGEKIYTLEELNVTGIILKEINFTNHSAGIYYVNVSTDNNFSTRKIYLKINE